MEEEEKKLYTVLKDKETNEIKCIIVGEHKVGKSIAEHLVGKSVGAGFLGVGHATSLAEELAKEHALGKFDSVIINAIDLKEQFGVDVIKIKEGEEEEDTQSTSLVMKPSFNDFAKSFPIKYTANPFVYCDYDLDKERIGARIPSRNKVQKARKKNKASKKSRRGNR